MDKNADILREISMPKNYLGKGFETMKKQLKITAALTAVISMAVIPSMVSMAETWKYDIKGWQVENDDHSYLTNQWYQSPSSGLWYYLGADGYMLTNTTTPDGYYVDENGVWNQAANPDITQNAVNTKDTAAVRQAAEAYNSWINSHDGNIASPSWIKDKEHSARFVFCDIDNDGIPECITTNGSYFWCILSYQEGEVAFFYASNPFDFYASNHLLYVPGTKIVCSYVNYPNGEEIRLFSTFDERTWKGASSYMSSQYSIAFDDYNPQQSTSKAAYDEYNNAFGQLVEISLKDNDTYQSINAACEVFLTQ